MENKNIDYEKTLRELLEQKQYTKLRQEISDMNPADVAAVMDEMEDDESLRIFRILPKGIAADVFANLEIEGQQYIIQSLSDKEASSIIDNLMADDATDLLEEMPANIVKKILKNAKPETRKDINHLLRYPEDSAGSIMTVEYVDLKENMTVADAVERIRKIALDSETVNICYRKKQPASSRNTTLPRCPSWTTKTVWSVSSPSTTLSISSRKRPPRISKRWRLSFLPIRAISEREFWILTGTVCPGFFSS